MPIAVSVMALGQSKNRSQNIYRAVYGIQQVISEFGI